MCVRCVLFCFDEFFACMEHFFFVFFFLGIIYQFIRRFCSTLWQEQTRLAHEHVCARAKAPPPPRLEAQDTSLGIWASIASGSSCCWGSCFGGYKWSCFGGNKTQTAAVRVECKFPRSLAVRGSSHLLSRAVKSAASQASYSSSTAI